MFYRQYREEKIVFPRHKVGKEYCFAHLSRTLDRNQKAYEKRTRSIEVQAIWANPIPQKEQASVLEEGVGMTVGAIGALPPISYIPSSLGFNNPT